MFERIRSDFNQHGSSVFNPSVWIMFNYRYGRWAYTIRLKPLRWLASKIYGLNMFLILITSGDTLHREITIGEDLHLIHSGFTRIHPKTVIGDRCGIQQGVTMGTNTERGGAPIIGNDVYIGTGAVILGSVKIGDGARVAANSLVISDVPENATAIGVPARIMRYSARSSSKEKNIQDNSENQGGLEEM